MDFKFMEQANSVPLFNVCQKDSSFILAISAVTLCTPSLSSHCIPFPVLSQPTLPCRKARSSERETLKDRLREKARRATVDSHTVPHSACPPLDSVMVRKKDC